ncbi:MAG: transposase [Rickettsia endosymbiont of Eriopis connexa]|nr:transposase [Rickettsia endosymbiont of Eriopis connexa]
MNKIKENDKIEIERLLKSHLNPELGEEIMGSIVDHWLQEGREEGRKKEKIIMVKEMKKEGFSLEAIMKITKLDKKEIEKLK